MKVFCLKFHGFGNILHNESQKKDFLQNRLLAKMLKMHLERRQKNIFLLKIRPLQTSIAEYSEKFRIAYKREI